MIDTGTIISWALLSLPNKYLFSNLLININVFVYLKDIIRGEYYMKKLENIVNKYYSDYQLYIPVKHMESYQLDVKPTHEMGLTMAETLKKDGIRYLFLNENFANDIFSSKKIKRWKIGILYHEFTHIADDEIFERVGIPLSKKYIYRLYTEYHAEFIKTLFLFGIHPFPDNKTEILHTDRIDSQYGSTSIFDYLKKMKIGYINDIDTGKMDDMCSFISYFDRLCYYLGAASVYRIFCDYKLNEIMNITGFVSKLGKVVEQIKDVLLESIAINFDENIAVKSAKLYIPLIQSFL